MTSINYGHQFHVDRYGGCRASASATGHHKKEPSEPKAQGKRKREPERADAGRVTGILKVIQNKQSIEKLRYFGFVILKGEAEIRNP